MNRKLILHLPGKGRLFVYAQLIWVMVMFWLRDVLGFPSSIVYLTDVLLLCPLVLHNKRILRGIRATKPTAQNRILCGILLAILVGIIINLANPLLALWAARNNLRFFVFFYLCIGLLEGEDIDRIISMLLSFFWFNVIVCTVQYFGQGLSGDFLGGLFGIKNGANSYMNILLCIANAVIFGRFFQKKAGIFQVALYLLASMYIAVLSELKAFYLEVVIIMLISMIRGGSSWKGVLLALVGALGIQVFFLFLSIYSPRTMVFMDSDILEVYLAGNGYTQKGDLNRFTAIGQIYDRFFSEHPLQAILGFGFGSCESSQFEFLKSDFARQYEHLHYRWFTHAWVFLEQGAVGLLLLTLFFLSLLVSVKRRNSYIRTDLSIAVFCFVPCCIFGMIYNCAIQLEACYMIAFMCALPFISCKSPVGQGTQTTKEGEAPPLLRRTFKKGRYRLCVKKR